MAKLANAKGEMVYFNLVQKNGKLQWVIKGIGDTVVLGRDRQKKKSRTFTQEAQADAYLKRNGFTISLYWGGAGERLRLHTGSLAAPSFCPCPRSAALAALWLFSIGKKTAIGRWGCLFMHPDAKGPHGAAQGPAGANAKRPPRA